MIDFIILGAQKAATSALQASLREHASVYMPKGESPFFEEPDYHNEPWQHFASDVPDSVVKGIKRPDYLCSDQAIARIKQHLPNCKFIVVLREPVSRTISSYCYMVRHAHLPALPLNEGLSNCMKAYQSNPDSRAASVISYGLYGAYLEKWFAQYDEKQFLVLSQKQVATDLKGTLKLCLAHLGIEHASEDELSLAQGEKNVGLYDPAMLKVARVASILKTKKIPNSPRRIPRALPMRALGLLLSQYAELRARMGGQVREKLDLETEGALRGLFEHDTQKLKGLVNQDAVYW